MQRIPLLFAAALAALSVAANAQAAGGDPAAGKRKSQTCASCHGANGASDNTMYPMLAGQHESYLYHVLRQYKSGERENAVMAGMVANLSDQDMRDLAAFYAAQEPAVFTAPVGRGAK